MRFPQQFSVMQVYGIAAVYILLLRLVIALAAGLIAHFRQPLGDVVQSAAAVITLPVLFVLIPLVGAVIIIAFTRPDSGTHPSAARPTPLDADPVDVFHSLYTAQQVQHILQWITGLWIAVLAARLIFALPFTALHS